MGQGIDEGGSHRGEEFVAALARHGDRFGRHTHLDPIRLQRAQPGGEVLARPGGGQGRATGDQGAQRALLLAGQFRQFRAPGPEFATAPVDVGEGLEHAVVDRAREALALGIRLLGADGGLEEALALPGQARGQADQATAKDQQDDVVNRALVDLDDADDVGHGDQGRCRQAPALATEDARANDPGRRPDARQRHDTTDDDVARKCDIGGDDAPDGEGEIDQDHGAVQGPSQAGDECPDAENDIGRDRSRGGTHLITLQPRHQHGIRERQWTEDRQAPGHRADDDRAGDDRSGGHAQLALGMAGGSVGEVSG